ncbi:GNAT family N-acetyltransferase [Phascolarctobacterium succinatutens]
MILVKDVKPEDNRIIDEVVSIHLETFTGFFLSFMGRGFLKQMYRSYCEHQQSKLLMAEENGEILGFVAYSSDFSGLYKFMIKNRLPYFAWYSIGAFFRRPSAFLHIISAFLKPGEAKREESYVELSSIGVSPKYKSKGVGSLLISELKKRVDFNKFAYITLETDAVNNEPAIQFYQKNAFVKQRLYKTSEGREMLEFRYCAGDKE